MRIITKVLSLLTKYEVVVYKEPVRNMMLGIMLSSEAIKSDNIKYWLPLWDLTRQALRREDYPLPKVGGKKR